MTRAQEIIKIIQDNDLLAQFFDSDNWENKEEIFLDENEEEMDIEFEEAIEKHLTSLGLPTNYEYKDGRCDTSEFWQVVYFPTEDIYIKVNGSYDSYGQYEHDYNNAEQVFPKTVTRTIYLNSK